MPGLVTAWPLGVAGALFGDAGQFGLDPGDCVVTLLRVTLGLVRVVADDEPHVGGIQADFLDAQVVPDLLVAALAGQHLLDLRVAAHAHPGDVVPDGAA